MKPILVLRFLLCCSSGAAYGRLSAAAAAPSPNTKARAGACQPMRVPLLINHLDQFAHHK